MEASCWLSFSQLRERRDLLYQIASGENEFKYIVSIPHFSEKKLLHPSNGAAVLLRVII